jgi:hypothetical protein
VLDVAAFGALPLALTVYAVYLCIHLHAYAIDFHQEFWPAAWRVAHGLSPYDRSWQIIDKGLSFPYPPLTSIAFVPFTLASREFADLLFTAVNIGAVLLTLRVLNIRDWRLYGLVLILSPVIDAWQAANLTLVLGLGVAIAWRKRDSPVVSGLIVAVLISLKPFVWPLLVWFVATRRYAALAYAAVGGLVINLIAWSVIGFDQVGPFVSLTRAVTDFQYRTGYTIIALGLHLGLGHSWAYLLGIAAAAAAILACFYLGRRGDDRRAVTLGIAACLLATPVLWVHYFALLIVPLALARPRLSGLWFLPLVLWVCPVKSAPWQIVLALAVNTALIIGLLRPTSPRTGDAALTLDPRDGGAVPALAAE